MASVTVLTFLINLTIGLYGPCVSGTSDVQNSPDIINDGRALESTLQGLLGLQNIPHSTSEHDFDVRMAPKYMLDLYEKYRSGGIHSGKQVANTVRSIQAQIGVINSENKFVFNLSAIVWSEKIIRAEIHLYKRRPQQSARRSDITMDIHELGPTFIRKLDHRRIPEASYGWQAADVTTAIQACRHYSDGIPRMMAVTFSAPHRTGHKTLSIKTLIRRISRPYLVVYSNDTQNITVDHIQPHISPLDLTSSYVDPSTGILERFSSFGRDKGDSIGSPEQDESSEPEEIRKDPEHRKWFGDHKFFKYFPSESHMNAGDSASAKIKPQISKISGHNEVYSTRIRRSVLDNEIPGTVDKELDPDEAYQSSEEEADDDNRPKRKHRKQKQDKFLPDAEEYGIMTPKNERREGQNLDQDVKPSHVPRTHPSILQGRTSSKHKSSRHKEQLIPYPENYKKNGRRNKKNRRKERRQNKTFRALRRDWGLEDVMTDNELRQMCSKRTLTVDFADIGWSEWIISPRSFEANYCSGSCPFPLAQKVNPSNHATIQSLVRAIGLNKDVPSPCCVPDKLSSVTLLYFDESKNVVLKNYPDMSVDSCACR